LTVGRDAGRRAAARAHFDRGRGTVAELPLMVVAARAASLAHDRRPIIDHALR